LPSSTKAGSGCKNWQPGRFFHQCGYRRGEINHEEHEEKRYRREIEEKEEIVEIWSGFISSSPIFFISSCSSWFISPLLYPHWNLRWVSRSTKAEKQITNYTKPDSYVRYADWSPSGDRIVYEYSEQVTSICCS
jgi:hypothetical protein